MSDNILKSTQFTENVDMTGAFTLTGSQEISANLGADGTATFAHLVVTGTAVIPGIAASSITFNSTGLSYITHGDVQSAIADVHNAMSPLVHNHSSLYAPIVHTHTAGSFTVTPHGNNGATTLQGALNFLEDDKSRTTHTHLGVYSPIGHNHTGVYALAAHVHSGVYSLIGHDHDSDYSDIAHLHTGVYSLITHTHSGLSSNALSISYDNTSSQLSADNVQDAIDELDIAIDDLYVQFDTTSELYALIGHNHDSDYSDIAHLHTGVYSALGHVHAALAITYDNSLSGMASTNVKDAIDELDASITTLNSDSILYDTTATDLISDNIEDVITEILERYDVVFHEGSDEIYVDSNRTDSYVEDGGFNTPFKSLEDAIDYANELVDETSGNALIINCASGTYEVENDITCSGNIAILSDGIAIINLDGNTFGFGDTNDVSESPWKINDGQSVLRNIEINDGIIMNVRPNIIDNCSIYGCMLINLSVCSFKNTVFSMDNNDQLLIGVDLPCAIGNFGGHMSFNNCDISIYGDYDNTSLVSISAPIIQLESIFGSVDTTMFAMTAENTIFYFNGHSSSAMIRSNYGILGFKNVSVDIDQDSTSMNEIEFVGVVENPNIRFNKVGYFDTVTFSKVGPNNVECGDNPIKIERCDFRKFNGTDIENVTAADYFEYSNTTSQLSADNVQDAIDELDIAIDSLNELNDSHVIYVSANWTGTGISTGSVNAPYNTFDEAWAHIVNDIDVPIEEWLDSTSTFGSYTIILKDGIYTGSFEPIDQIAFDLSIRGEGSNVTLSGYSFSFGGVADTELGTISYTDIYTTTKLENLTITDGALVFLSDKNIIKNCSFTNCFCAMSNEAFMYNSTFQMNDDATVYALLEISAGIINLSKTTFNNCNFYKDGLPSNALLLQSSLGGDLSCTTDTKCRFINCTYISSDEDDTMSTIIIGAGGIDSMGSFFSGNFSNPLVLIQNEEEQSSHDNYIGNTVFINEGAGAGCYVNAADLNTTYLLSGNIGAAYEDISNVVLQNADSIGYDNVNAPSVSNVEEALDDLISRVVELEGA